MAILLWIFYGYYTQSRDPGHIVLISGRLCGASLNASSLQIPSCLNYTESQNQQFKTMISMYVCKQWKYL